MRNVRQNEAQVGIKISGEIKITSDMQMTPPLWQKAKKKKQKKQKKTKLKSLLIRVKEENKKVGLNSTFRKLRSWHLVPSLLANK